MKSAKPSAPPANMDEFIAGQPENYRDTLGEMRTIIKSIVPNATESISYMVPCFKHIYMLVGIGATKDFCSLYTMSPPLMKAMKEELKGQKVAGATIHFTPGRPLPVDLIRRIVEARARENEEKAIARKK
ncbi:MAG: DUF1801 domain-containing protein [Bacteroidetes bacterium]|nr:DUF1801 domain-containing protein [Bacteroidota bacterium]